MGKEAPMTDLSYKEVHSRSPDLQFLYSWGKDGACTKVGRQRRRLTTILGFLKDVFLPEGFPASVSDDYLQYQFWDTVQAFASSISGSLATQAVLQGVGVGDESATALAATITWLLRQGTGMASQIVFTWTQGLDLDYNCKRWRLFADLANDAAMSIELTAPYLKAATDGAISVQAVLCVASVARTLCGVAGGATRTAITQHQARNNNISDVAAKDGSQETMVNLTALALNLAVLPWISDNQVRVWTAFFLLTCLHLYANFRAVKSLVFNTLNKDRLLLVIDSYHMDSTVPKPQTVNSRESVFLGFGLDEKRFLSGKRITLGAPLSKLGPLNNVELVAESLKLNRFYIHYNGCGEINVVLSNSHLNKDLLVAYFAAYRQSLMSSSKMEDVKGDEWWQENVAVPFKSFEENLKQCGWVTEYVQLSELGWTGSFNL